MNLYRGPCSIWPPPIERRIVGPTLSPRPPTSMTFRPILRSTTLRRWAPTALFFGALVCAVAGYKFALLCLLVLATVLWDRQRAPARPSARGLRPGEDSWIRDPTNVSSPFGDYDPHKD
jgi:hypothetical protein